MAVPGKDGFELKVTITDRNGWLIEEETLVVPANTIERAAAAVIDHVTKRFETNLAHED